MGALWSLVVARARAHASGWALVAVGVALATAVPVLTAASNQVASAGALEHGLADLPVGRRSVTISYNGLLAGAQLETADQAARGQLRRLSRVAALRQVVFRRLSNPEGAQLTLGAVDGLSRAVRLTSGRLPSSCEPKRCEVVQVGRRPSPSVSFLGVVIVGRVERTNPLVLSGTFDPGTDAPVLLAADTERVAALEVLQVFQRSWGWVTAIDLALVGRLGVDGYLARESDVSDVLFRRLEGLIVTAPDDILRSQDSRARRSASRFALLGGTSAALVLGLAVVGAVGARRDHLNVVRLLRTRGARKSQLRLFSSVEASWPVLVGATAGPAAAYLGSALLWGWPVAAAGVTGGAEVAASLATAAALTIVVVLRWTPQTGERGAWWALGVAAAGIVAATALAGARGSTQAIPSGRADPLVALLPMLAALAAGLVAACGWPLLARIGREIVPRRATRWRLSIASAGRQPLRGAATVAVVAATCTSVVFAGAYRSTLAGGAADQSAYAVPMIARLTTGPSLVRPADVVTPEAATRLAPGAVSYPVLRAAAAISLSTLESAPVEMLGLDPSAVRNMAHWRQDYSNAGPSTLARRLESAPPKAGPGLPDGASRLAVPATGSTARLTVIALIRDRTGRSQPITLHRKGNSLVGAIPAAPGRTLAGLTMQEDVLTASLRQHVAGEGGAEQPARTGRVVLGHPAADGRPLSADLRGWSATSGGRSGTVPGGLMVDYRIAGNATRVTPPGSAPGPVPALVDRDTAAQARNGLLSLSLGPDARLALRVVGRGDRFPTTRGRFAVLDRAALSAAVDAVTPGAGTPTEAWVWAPPGGPARTVERRLAQAPYDVLDVASRSDIERSLRTDPIAVMASRLLLGAAGAGLVVAALCVVLLVGAERREAAGELFAQEADGARPAQLRRSLFARASTVVGFATPVGVAVGLVLARATTFLVTVTAGGTTPSPPLVTALDPTGVAARLAVLLAVSLSGAAIVATRSLRGPLPVAPETDLR